MGRRKLVQYIKFTTLDEGAGFSDLARDLARPKGRNIRTNWPTLNADLKFYEGMRTCVWEP